MADALAGKRISTITYIAPDINAAEAMRDYLDSHKEFMAAKCYRDGPLKLIHYFFSEGPEYEENRSWLEGKYPKKTGRTIFHLYHMYETEEGVHHHWFEISEFLPVLSELIKTFNIEVIISNQLTVVQSLWE
jgi:hypothetical protein